MYLTIYKKTNPNLENIDYNNIMQTTALENTIPEYYKITIDIPNPNALTEAHKTKILQLESHLIRAYAILLPFEENYEQQYYEFKIPKRSGGLRTINAPLPEFKEALSKVKDIFEKDLKCLSHDAAYAYTKQRSVYDALTKHQINDSKWFLKIDLTDFFPSCTPELIYNQLTQLYPFYYFQVSAKAKLKKIIEICCLNNGLPQGTPMSPLLTNLIMVPYDYTIYNTLKRGLGQHFVYTRYADDMLISSKSDFDWKHIQQLISACLGPFQIKEEKTRYGSRAGSNWNLGLMLNKDNNITLGSKKKKLINAMLHNLFNDFKNNVKWPRDDVYALQGQLSYLHNIEPDYHDYLINKYQTKFNLNYKRILRILLNN